MYTVTRVKFYKKKLNKRDDTRTNKEKKKEDKKETGKSPGKGSAQGNVMTTTEGKKDETCSSGRTELKGGRRKARVLPRYLALQDMREI